MQNFPKLLQSIYLSDFGLALVMVEENAPHNPEKTDGRKHQLSEFSTEVLEAVLDVLSARKGLKPKQEQL